MNNKTLETALLEQKEEFLANLGKAYCTRPEEKLVNLNSKLAQIVIGIRRSGKSTLCLNVIKKSKLNFAYVNFDDERLNNAKAEDLNQILQYLYTIYGDFNHLFIDEIQNVEGWFLFVNRLFAYGHAHPNNRIQCKTAKRRTCNAPYRKAYDNRTLSLLFQ